MEVAELVVAEVVLQMVEELVPVQEEAIAVHVQLVQAAVLQEVLQEDVVVHPERLPGEVILQDVVLHQGEALDVNNRKELPTDKDL